MSLQEAFSPGASPVLGGRAYGLYVLVVEDDAADAHLLMRALNDHQRVGHVECAGDGVEALELLDDTQVNPDVAIVDLQMPRMNGFKLLVELACRPGRKFPVIVLTSSKAAADASRSLLRGANRVITKPERLEDLELEIASALAAV